MKTVEGVDGTVKRVSDEEADEMVASGLYQFVPKHKWKKQEAPVEEGEVHAND